MNDFKLTDFILQKNVVSKELCKEIIDLTTNDDWQKHQWYMVQDDKSVSYDDKELDVLFPDPILTLNRYTPGTTMRTHIDHIHSLFDGRQKGIPVLSMIGILNEDYDGGELVFFDDYKIKTKTGDLIIFPSCFLYPHAIEEVTKGTRYSFVSWAW